MQGPVTAFCVHNTNYPECAASVARPFHPYLKKGEGEGLPLETKLLYFSFSYGLKFRGLAKSSSETISLLHLTSHL